MCNAKNINKPYQELVQFDTLNKVATIFKRTSRQNHPDLHEQSRRQLLYLFNEYVFNQQSDILGNMQKAMAKVSISLPGAEPMSYQQINTHLVQETNPQRREALRKEYISAFNEHVAPYKQQLLQAELKVIEQLGFNDPVDFYAQLYGHPLTELANQFDSFMNKTDDLFNTYGIPYLQEASGRSLVQMNDSDSAFVLGSFNPVFQNLTLVMTHQKLIKAIKKTLKTMGVDDRVKMLDIRCTKAYRKHLANISHDNPQIFWDYRSRPGKRSRGITWIAHVPGEIYSVSTQGSNTNADSWRTELHELFGHALHFAHVDPQLPFSQQALGSMAVTEAYAVVFESLLTNPHWLKNMANITHSKTIQSIQQFKALRDLITTRNIYGKLKLDVAFYHNTAKQNMTLNDEVLNAVETMYADTFNTTMGYRPINKGTGLMSKDANVYSASYMIAKNLGSHLLHYLKTNFDGDAWYQNEDALNFMKSLWQQGNLTPEAVADAIQLPQDRIVDADQMIEYLKEGLEPTTEN